MSYGLTIPWGGEHGEPAQARLQTAETALEAVAVIANRRWRREPEATVSDEAGVEVSLSQLVAEAVGEAIASQAGDRLGATLADLVASELHPMRAEGRDADPPAAQWRAAGMRWAEEIGLVPPMEMLVELSHRHHYSYHGVNAFQEGVITVLGSPTSEKSDVGRARDEGRQAAEARSTTSSPPVSGPIDVQRPGTRRMP